MTVVVYDPGGHEPDRIEQYPEFGLFWRDLKDRMSTAGLPMVRIDAFNHTAMEPDHVLLVSHGWSQRSQALMRRGARGAVLLSWESPIIDQPFYFELPRVSPKFRSVYVCPGAQRRVRPGRQYRPLYPMLIQSDLVDRTPWSERGFLTAILGNRFQPEISIWNLVRAALARYLAPGPASQKDSVRRQLLCLLDPALARSLYEERARAIVHFAAAPDFTLYGHGWDPPDRYTVPPAVHAAAMRRYGGVARHAALDVMSRFRFVLCFDNTRFPGYFSERLLRTFVAGCIPVYYGAPDIERYVPIDAIVDVRDFVSDSVSYDRLEMHLRAMSPQEVDRKREAGRQFLRSERAREYGYAETGRRIAAAVVEAAAA